MRKILGLLLAVVFALPFGALAGSSADPEVVDPAGDAFAPTQHGLNADWADITGVWFSSVRSTGGGLNGFRVHVGTLGDAAAPDRDAGFNVSWEVATADESYCFASLDIDRIDPGDVWGHGRPGALLYYGCDADGTTVEANGHPVFGNVPWMTPVPLEYLDTGTELIVTIPLQALSEGASSQGVYVEGALLQGAYADSWSHVSAPDGSPITSSLLVADRTGCAQVSINDEPCGPRPFVLGS